MERFRHQSWPLQADRGKIASILFIHLVDHFHHETLKNSSRRLENRPDAISVKTSIIQTIDEIDCDAEDSSIPEQLADLH